MTKQEFLLLEKIFSADISNTQFHSKSKLAKKLIDDGYVKEIIEKKTSLHSAKQYLKV